LLWPIVLGGALALALMFLFTRLRLASMWLAAFAASMALLALAGQGTPVLSPGLLIYPAYFLTLCVATLAIGLGGQKVRVPGVRWRLPAFLAMAVLAGASFYAQQRRMTARLDAGDLLSAAAPARPTLPEVAYMASEARLAEAIAGADVEARREMVREADALWEQAINSYLDTRERLPRAPAPHLPESLFGEWVEKLLRENKLPEALDFLRDMARLEPQNPAHRLQLAFLLATSGEMDEAAQIMRGALKEARSTKSASALAKSPEHKFMLAFLLFRVGEVQEGEKLLREVAATVEDAADLGVRMAERVARTSGDEAAVRFATAFIEKGNLGPQPLARAMYERGRILSRMPGREAEARRDLESALSHPDLRDRARALLARVSLETGDYARVRELSRQPGEPQSIPDFEAVMGLNIAQALQTGRQEKAREWLDGWVETAASGQPKARAYMERAHVADQANRQADALRDFRAAVAEAPSFAPASRGLADFLLRNKFYDEAEQVLRDGFSRAGEDMAMLAVYAELMIALGKAQTALPVLESHLQSRKGPDRPEPHYWLGRVYSALELWPLAIDRYKKTLELAPDHKDAKLYLATALQKTPEFERGAELLVELIGQDPANEDLYGRLAELYRVNADLESAALAISKGLHNTGNRSATLYIKGAEIALDANRLDVAEKSARQAIALEAPGSRLRAKAEQLLQKTLDAKARAESVAQLQAQAEEKK
jgi:tetratricopeptide (TPR) repeat protein